MLTRLDKAATEHKEHDPNSPFPSKSEETIRVPMSQRQQDIHDYMMGKAPMWVRWKVRHGLPPTKSEARQLNAFMGGTRQVSNTTYGYHKSGMPESPKIDTAFHHLQQHLGSNPRSKAVIYSSFKRSGLHPYKARLERAGIPHGEFSGDMPKHERNQMVQDYNAGKLKVLLISRAGAEGLDLKGTRLIQVMEPHWNEEHIKQVVGRGVRYMSHAHLPPEERHVHVQRFVSVRTPKGVFERIGIKKPGYGTDEYVQQMAHEKEHVNEQFRHILREAGDRPYQPKQQHQEGVKHASASGLSKEAISLEFIRDRVARGVASRQSENLDRAKKLMDDVPDHLRRYVLHPGGGLYRADDFLLDKHDRMVRHSERTLRVLNRTLNKSVEENYLENPKWKRDKIRDIVRSVSKGTPKVEKEAGEGKHASVGDWLRAGALAATFGTAGYHFTDPMVPKMTAHAPALSGQIEEHADKVKKQMAGSLALTGAALPLALRKKKGK